jgi:site-specific DNA-methyltransferase (adenine-specific)
MAVPGGTVKPYYEQDGVTIYQGDCLEIAPALSWDCLCSDPPWGTDTACDSQRFTRKASPWWDVVDTSKVRQHKPIANDRAEFDPRPWISRPSILWGANNFTRHLPHSNGWLIWDKRLGAEDIAEKGWPLGEAELAWTNAIGATRVFRNLWSGLLRSSEKGEFYHPTQKPVALMQWCLSFLPPGVVIDPYMGAGSTLRAAKDTGRRAIGIELEERYCEIAARRLAQRALPLHGEVA